MNEPNARILLIGRGWSGKPQCLQVTSFADFIKANTPEQVYPALERLEQALQQGYYAAGYIAYEAAQAFNLPTHISDGSLPYLWFGIFRGDDLIITEMNSLTKNFSPFEREVSYPVIRTSIESYCKRLDFIQNQISAGNTYQVNYTIRSYLRMHQDPLEWFLSLYRWQPVPYAAFMQVGERVVLSLSPELFLERRGNRILSKPMKGTIGRGRYPEEDRRYHLQLFNSEKDRAENVMIVDMVRNDLGKVCRYGSVTVDRLFDIGRYRTLFQMTSTVRGELKEGVTLLEILAAAFPAASITGAPKRSTMNIIRNIEDTPRAIYCGSIGLFQPNGDFTLNVAIRSLHGLPPCYTLGLGGGIVADSQPEREYEEIHTKMQFIQSREEPFELIETIRLNQDGYLYLDEHLHRLSDSADYFDYPHSIDEVLDALHKYRKKAGPKPVAIRLTLNNRGEVKITHRDITRVPEQMRIRLSPQPVSSRDLFLFHKTTRRTLYNQEREKASQAGFFEVIFQNERGHITEGSITNLMYKYNGQWYTPPLDDGLLPGIWRAITMRELSARECSLTTEALSQVQKILIGNSVIGSIQLDHL